MERRTYLRRKMPALLQSDAKTVVYKRRRNSSPVSSTAENEPAGDFFDWIPDDLVLTILSRLSSTATCPSDFINATASCKRFRHLCFTKLVLSQASLKMLAVKAKNWSDSAHRLLCYCSRAGNLNACYILGMIRFYCLGYRLNGISLLAKAAIGMHAQALYSLAIIQFNGSGGSKRHKDLQAGVAFCVRAASLGHFDALREFGHCLQDGYGVPQNILQGRRCLIHVTYNEIAGKINAMDEMHPANAFMADWFSERMGMLEKEDLRLCSNKGCGRPETRMYEFRRCSLCGTVNYCSRACQSIDWKMSHKMTCTAGFVRRQIPAELPFAAAAGGGGGGAIEQRAA
ncbi:F-box protein At1g67340-like [Phalaenopsis equestris]|uniref:F-box protein At1g67340-like n=1 Tax=Phalaenopsis equestris TaxID=78828 RepID=UPI0009E1949E|nr:F-box protein At1g67340-like [Phalaenopsis equestris]